MWARLLEEPETKASTVASASAPTTTSTSETTTLKQGDQAWSEFRSLGEQQRERDQLRAAEDEKKRQQIETAIQRAREALERQNQGR